jgi:hypothetical protein
MARDYWAVKIADRGGPRLLESRTLTIDQMRSINALCRFAEMAEEQAASAAR